jgi:hypothetical protein
VAGSAVGSFAGGFPSDASLYDSSYPHLSDAHLLRGRSDEVDERAFEVGLTALVAGFEALMRDGRRSS